MRKRKTMIAGIMLITMLTLAGCNINKSTDNIKHGFQFITTLEYEEALNCFAAATEAKEDPQQIARGQGIAYLGLAKYKEAIEQFITALSYSNEFIDDFDFHIYILSTLCFQVHYLHPVLIQLIHLK